MADFTVNPAVKPSTGNASQLQRMKLFTMALAIHSPVKQFYNILTRSELPGSFIHYFQVVSNYIFNIFTEIFNY